eukprot:scaffold1945_cov395-Prasinococcus_capsulatus_cf.AAC.2
MPPAATDPSSPSLAPFRFRVSSRVREQIGRTLSSSSTIRQVCDAPNESMKRSLKRPTTYIMPGVADQSLHPRETQTRWQGPCGTC